MSGDVHDTKPFLQMLPAVLNTIRVELATRKAGGRGPGNMDQLEFFLRELERVGRDIESGRLPVGRTQLQSARIIVDEWPYDHPLAMRVMELSALYQELCIR